MDGKHFQIILYDGVCKFCDGTVRFILPRDSRGSLRFASLQSEFAKGIMSQYGIPQLTLPESIIFIEDDRPYLYSTGVLRLARHLDFPWNLAVVFLIVPRALRDVIYRWIARNRYRWFGKSETCLLPHPEWRDRFLG